MTTARAVLLRSTLGWVVAGFALTGVLATLLVRNAVTVARLDFQRESITLAERARHHSERPVDLVAHIAALRVASIEVDAEELRRFVAALPLEYPTIVYGYVGAAPQGEEDVLVWSRPETPFAREAIAVSRARCVAGGGRTLVADLRADAEGRPWVVLLLEVATAAVDRPTCAIALAPSGEGVATAFRAADDDSLSGYLFRPGDTARPWACFEGGTGRVECGAQPPSRERLLERYWRTHDAGPISSVPGAPALLVTPRVAVSFWTLTPAVVWLAAALGVIATLAFGVLRFRMGIGRLEVARRDRLYRALIDDSPVAFIGWDAAGRVIEWNPAALRMFGMAKPRAVPAWLSAAGAKGAGTPRPDPEGFLRMELARADGASFAAEVLVRTIDADESVLRMAFIRDLSAQRDAEVAQQRAERVLGAAELASGFAHDFNNLLTVISGNLELLEPVVGADPEAAEDLASARRATRRPAGFRKRSGISTTCARRNGSRRVRWREHRLAPRRRRGPRLGAPRHPARRRAGPRHARAGPAARDQQGHGGARPGSGASVA